MTAGKFFAILIVFVLAFSACHAQKKSKSQLQREKQQNLEKIREVEKILNETANRKQNTIGELSALNQRIIEQENLISSIKKEISFLDGEIGENNDIIQALQSDVEKLKKEYRSMLFAAQKANNSSTRLTFLFSAASFDQLIMRLRYMEQYADTRKLQAELITQVQEELTGQIKHIETQKSEKSKLLDDGVTENKNLADLKRKQNVMVKSLEKEEKKLKKDLQTTKETIAKLDKLIENIIREELEREAALAAAASASTKATAVALSSSFAENRNKLPWPVGSGFISQKFGLQNHPVLKGIVIKNEGVNIQTPENEKVKCVFPGQVTRVAYLAGIGSTVLVKHGEYFTVYAGLKDVSVKQGQQLIPDQEIGKVIQNTEGVPELRFQIFKNMQALDPQGWLRNL
jgi:septal ring factor EnvC (AmiA/AmiB activator)